MVLVYWIIFNLIFDCDALRSGSVQSSSIGVLSSSGFPTTNDENIPISGVKELVPDCGWKYAAAGSTSPGYYVAPNFGTFNLGEGNIGQANAGYNNTGFGNFGYGNIGRLNSGNDNIGYFNDGSNNMGAMNSGDSNIGDGNTSIGSPCIGYNNTACSAVIGALTTQSTFSVGIDLQGGFLFGINSTGTGLIGQDNTGVYSIGFGNEEGFFNGNIGLDNIGDGLVGANNVGTNLIGQYNEGLGLIGLFNQGNFLIGVNNTNTTIPLSVEDYIIGYNNTGDALIIGANNEGGADLIGFALVGSTQIGGTFEDTSEVPLSEPIIFDPTSTIYTTNIGSNFNPSPSEAGPNIGPDPFITDITAEYRFNLEFPAILTVVDLGCPGDIIEVFDWSSLIMTTTIPQPALVYNCTGIDDGEEALADPFYSRNFITLSPGLHILTFALAPGSANNGTALAFRVDSIRPRGPCAECEAPVPLIDSFDNVSIDLPDDFRLYVETEVCPPAPPAPVNPPTTPTQTYNATQPLNSPAQTNNATNPTNPIPSTDDTSTSGGSDSRSSVFSCRSCEKSAIVWCQTKNFQMPRDITATHPEAKDLCVAGLAQPSTPAAQLEIYSLLLQCALKSSIQESNRAPWIGSDWNGNDYNDEYCLVANGEDVQRAKNCNGKRKLICAR